MRVARSHIDSGSFTPHIVLAGEFSIFCSTGPAPVKKASTFIEHTDFVNQYTLDTARVLTPAEESMVPELPEWYIIPPEVVDICKHAQCTTGKSMQMRNFLLRGPAGTALQAQKSMILSVRFFPMLVRIQWEMHNWTVNFSN